ncbi:MAG: terminase family protein [Bryobacteraceae bacterium]
MGRSRRQEVQFRKIAYKPLESQQLFHDSAARFKGFSGPIGSGKSQALCHEAIKLSYINIGRVGLLGAPTYPMLRDATLMALFESLDSNKIPYDYNKADSVLTMRDTQSRILCRSMEDFERLRGTNLAWFGMDELTYTPEPAWLRLEGRLRDPKATRLCGFAVWTPKGYDWVYHKFVSGEHAGYETILAKPQENKHLLAQVPDFYERLKHSYDEKFYRQEVLGQYLNLQGGQVYSAFRRDQNVRSLSKDDSAPLLWALDFNVDPMSSVIAQIVRGTVHVLDEIVLRHASTSEACEEFHRRFGSHSAGLVVYGDASGFSMNTSGSSDFQVIREFFVKTSTPVQYRVPKANPQVRDRIAVMNGKLGNACGQAQLYMDPRCRELVKDMEQVAYKQDSNLIDKDRDRRRTHLSDALGYLIWQECRPVAEVGEKGNRLV